MSDGNKNTLTDQIYFLQKEFWLSPRPLLFFTLSLFLIIFLRYLLLSGAYHWWFLRKKVNVDSIPNRQYLKEVRWSLLSSGIFTLLTVLMVYVHHLGFTKVYTQLSDFGWLYFVASIAVYLLLYETYYYWLHRWMHSPHVFKTVHKIHHESIHTSAFTSFSFHPLEALLQFIFLPLLILTVPVHIYALGIFLILMTLSAIINHAGIEIYPPYFLKHKLTRWLIGSTHHELHHKEFRTNYGLYFTFWDKWMRTESKRYNERFEHNVINRSRSQHHPSADDQHT